MSAYVAIAATPLRRDGEGDDDGDTLDTLDTLVMPDGDE
jgi:hypothetical protein